jgi:hypothetical protein
VGKNEVTLRWRKRRSIHDAQAPADGQVLGVFADLGCVFIYPDAEDWVVLDEETVGSIELSRL